MELGRCRSSHVQPAPHQPRDLGRAERRARFPRLVGVRLADRAASPACRDCPAGRWHRRHGGGAAIDGVPGDGVRGDSRGSPRDRPDVVARVCAESVSGSLHSAAGRRADESQGRTVQEEAQPASTGRRLRLSDTGGLRWRGRDLRARQLRGAREQRASGCDRISPSSVDPGRGLQRRLAGRGQGRPTPRVGANLLSRPVCGDRWGAGPRRGLRRHDHQPSRRGSDGPGAEYVRRAVVHAVPTAATIHGCRRSKPAGIRGTSSDTRFRSVDQSDFKYSTRSAFSAAVRFRPNCRS